MEKKGGVLLLCSRPLKKPKLPSSTSFEAHGKQNAKCKKQKARSRAEKIRGRENEEEKVPGDRWQVAVVGFFFGYLGFGF